MGDTQYLVHEKIQEVPRKQEQGGHCHSLNGAQPSTPQDPEMTPLTAPYFPAWSILQSITTHEQPFAKITN